MRAPTPVLTRSADESESGVILTCVRPMKGIDAEDTADPLSARRNGIADDATDRAEATDVALLMAFAGMKGTPA